MGIWPPKGQPFTNTGIPDTIGSGLRILRLATDRQGTLTFPFEARIVHSSMNGTIREHLKPGMKVKVVLKKDQRSAVLTEGIIKSILTKSPMHPHGIKVILENGAIGRVKEIVQ